MSVTLKLIKLINKMNAKHFIVATIFTLALAGAVGMGLASRGSIHASTIRDTDPVNSIDGCDANGGIGAADANELIKDINDPKCANQHLSTIYADPQLGSLTPDLYNQFAAEAQEGLIWRDGHVTVGNQTVMTGVWTMGRTTMGSKQRDPIVIGGVTYYHSPPSVSFAASRQNLPVMVWFDANGEVRVAIMNPCGNGVGGGVKVKNSVSCDALNATQPDATHKPNTYNFTASATPQGNAVISKVVYHFSDDNSDVSKNTLTEAVEHTFTKDADVTVTVFATVPGGHTIQSTSVVHCQRHIKFVPPMFVCVNLLPTALDEQKKSFRFTVIAKTDNTGSTTLTSVDFILDNKNTTTGVTTKDAQGNIYKEYTFTDDVTHTVKTTLTFNTSQGVQSVDCQASVTPKKTPVCEVPGHEGKPIDSNCGYCQPNIPIGDARCTPTPPTPPVLTNTGPGDVLGLFGATSFAGFFGHKAFRSRKNRRAAKLSE